MMKQYNQIKNKYADAILMFRLGDFYEMFFDDAITASRELDLTLTGRNCGLEKRAPMCGVPYHALDNYVAKLVKKGYKVAICEQLQDPKDAKGMVDRGITRIITGGTITDNETLETDKNNFLMSLYLDDTGVGAVWTDISTSQTYNHFIPYPYKVKLNDLLLRVKPAEIICNSKMLAESPELSAIKYGSVCPMSQYDDDKFDIDVAKTAISSLLSSAALKDLLKTPNCVCAEGAIIEYIRSMQLRSNVNVGAAENYESALYTEIDSNTARTLELLESSSRKKGYSLFDVLNRTKTPMGGRFLRDCIMRPLRVKIKIDERLDAVEALYSNTIARERIKKSLSGIKDIVRISSSLLISDIKSRDALSLAASLRNLPEIRATLGKLDAPLLKDIYARIDPLEESRSLLDRAIYNFSESDKDKESYIIASGYNEKLDEYRELVKNSRSVIAQLESNERQKTGINALKISYNRLFGYYIEVPRRFDDQVPEYYKRRQTVANAERYVTDELKELEYKTLNAAEFADKLEKELYADVLKTVRADCNKLNSVGKAIGELDCLVSFASVAKENGYAKPIITENDTISITEGRHPVAELMPADEIFVPNGTELNDKDSKIMLITGPNMAGKSLYMRQVALITVMAHMGSFVPAKSASICLVDKVFTRVGASDDISTGRSTFMVEMSEVSQIVENVTDKSLVLLDEIGRGTSTYDGLSLAWSLLEYFSKNSAAKVLFSTHYHELTELEGSLCGIKNYKFTAKEHGDGIKFLRKIMRGSANKSFGIEVAALAGLPSGVLDRAKQILAKLVNADIAKKANDNRQISLFDNVSRHGEIITILKELNIDDITPRAALDILCDLKEKIEL